MGWSLELIHCQSHLVLHGALHGLERTLQLVRPTLSSIWVIVIEERWWSEMQEPLQEVVTVTWDPRPREPVEGVLRATSVLELAAT